MEWKDLLAAEVLVDRVDDQRVGWMTRATPLLAGEFNLSEFMVAAGSNDLVRKGTPKKSTKVRTFPHKTSFP